MGFIRQRHVRSHLSFKDQYGDRRFRYTEVNDQAWVDELNRKINEERNKPVPAPVVTEVKKEVVKNEMLGMTVSFIIDKYNITDIQKRMWQKLPSIWKTIRKST